MKADRNVTCSLVFLRSQGIIAADWSVNLPASPICALIGSTVVLPCSYNFPQTPNGFKEEGGLPAQVIQYRRHSCVLECIVHTILLMN